MSGMNSGVNVNDPTVIAAFKAVLLHQGLIALLIFGILGLAWVSLRAWLPLSVQTGVAAPGTPATVPAEPAGRQVLRIGFGLLWVFDGRRGVLTGTETAASRSVSMMSRFAPNCRFESCPIRRTHRHLRKHPLLPGETASSVRVGHCHLTSVNALGRQIPRGHTLTHRVARMLAASPKPMTRTEITAGLRDEVARFGHRAVLRVRPPRQTSAMHPARPGYWAIARADSQAGLVPEHLDDPAAIPRLGQMLQATLHDRGEWSIGAVSVR